MLLVVSSAVFRCCICFLTFQKTPSINAETVSNVNSNNHNSNQIYLDVKPANTTAYLEAIRHVPLSTYKLAYERSKANRVRVGVLGPELSVLIPDAVDILPKRVLPPLEKGGEPIILKNVPIVNDQTLFFYAIGAVKELDSIILNMEKQLDNQVEIYNELQGEVAKIERMFEKVSDEGSQVKMREVAANAKLLKAKLDVELEKQKSDQEYAKAQKEVDAQMIKRNEEMTKKRLEQENDAAKLRYDLGIKKKLEANRLTEAVRSKSAEALSKIDHEQSLEKERAAQKIKEETEKAIARAKAEAERANEDLHLRRLKAELEQKRKGHIAAIQAIFNHFSSLLSSALDNPKQVFIFIGFAAMFAVAIYSARELARLCRVIIESAIGKPRLIRETTRISYFKHIYTSVGKFNRSKTENLNNMEHFFDDLILPKELKNRIMSIAISSRKARYHNAPLRHILLYGPPGTGKTMVARKLAHCVGMDYALMSGGDVGPLGADAVTQIHALFSWAKYSPRGVLLFIDEAEAFLGSRSKETMSESAHNALNALLYNTSGERKDFMLVIATNRAQDIDSAVLDRCDESLSFPLPDPSCRSKLISLYFRNHARKAVDENNQLMASLYHKIKVFFSLEEDYLMSIEDDVFDCEQLAAVVNITKGFSGREIGKLMIAIQGFLNSSNDGILRKEDVTQLVNTKLVEHEQKKKMIRSNYNNTFCLPSPNYGESSPATSAVKRVSSAFQGASKNCDFMMKEVKQLF